LMTAHQTLVSSYLDNSSSTETHNQKDIVGHVECG